MDLVGAKKYLLDKFEKELPKGLFYHSIEHTLDVMKAVLFYTKKENINEYNTTLILTAALFHDSGFLIKYRNNEASSVKIVKKILPDYYYKKEEIDAIEKMIMSTKIPQKPNNILEQILCDADLDYLGRVDFIPVSNMLYKELHEHGRIGTIQEWNEMQIKFIEKHQYFTNTARRLRNVNKNSQLENIKKWIEENKL